VPDRVLTNFDLEKMVETTDEWIRTRTGIVERRIIAPGQLASDLTREASLEALRQAGKTPADVDLIVVATCTPDNIIPSAACTLQHALGATNAAGFDLNAACSGYLYALTVVNALIVSGQCRCALVVGVDVLSSVTNWTDRNTCVLFGDAAGASVLVPSHDETGVRAAYIGSDGGYREMLNIPAGGVRKPLTHEGLDNHENCIFMKGNEVFKIAVKSMALSAQEALRLAGMTPDQIDLVIPHQANIRIINSIAERLQVPEEKVYVTVHKYGNTSASSVPVAMYDAMQEGKIKPGSTVLMVAFGSGLTWAGTIIRF
jgi:3-oxoacyl-[acyl-carrier-protein] synthase-3